MNFNNKQKMNILFLGCGKMGSIILNNIIDEKSVWRAKISIIEKRKDIKVAKGKIYNDLSELKNKKYHADLVFICVKPQNSQEILQDLKDSNIIDQNSILVSILAGKKIEFFENIFGENTKIIRSMPNLAIGQSQGIFLYKNNNYVNSNDLKKVNKIFSNFGLAYELQDEDLFDPLTAIFGSGPGYLFLLQEVLANIVTKYNISKIDAEALVKQLFLGTSLMSFNEADDFLQLKNNVTSKNGTTEAGLRILEENDNLAKLFDAAISNSNKRSIELSK